MKIAEETMRKSVLLIAAALLVLSLPRAASAAESAGPLDLIFTPIKAIMGSFQPAPAPAKKAAPAKKKAKKAKTAKKSKKATKKKM